MSVKHARAVWGLELPALTQHVLHALADHACECCGLAWPSVPTLAAKCNLGATTVREALDRLERAGLLRVHAYPQGGRGRSTQYVVLPELAELSTAPCGKCAGNLRNPPPRVGFDKSVTDKPTAARGVSAKPTAPAVKTHRRGDPQPVAEVLAAIAAAEKSHRESGEQPS